VKGFIMKSWFSLTVSAKSMAAMLFASIVFGLSFLFTKMALAMASPLVLLAFRFLLAFILLNVLLLTGKVQFSMKGKRKAPLVLLGICQPVIYFLCENYGLRMTSTTFSAVMIALIPITSLLGGMLFLREIPSPWQVVFLLMSLAGIILLALRKSSEGTASLPGILLLALAVVAQVIFSSMSRKFSRQYTPFERTYFMFLVATAFFVPAALAESRFDVRKIVAYLAYPEVMVAVLFLGVFCSVGAFLAFNYASSHLPVARTAAFANITTAVSVAAGVMILKESFDYFVLVTTLMIVAGVWGVQKFNNVRIDAPHYTSI
jgi:drug/metabolite transporter (DMT)-like permease